MLGELSASLAHELKQPLAAILSNAQAAQRFLADDPADVNEVRAILKDIAESDRRATEIIRRMMAMMKKGEAQMQPHDINADIEQVLGLLHSELASRQVAVATQLLPGLPAVHGDHIQLQQVLLNLIVNGCDAMHDTPPGERRLVITTERAADDMVCVSVTDRGPGIAPEILSNKSSPPFALFHQVHYFYTASASAALNLPRNRQGPRRSPLARKQFPIAAQPSTSRR